MKRLLINDDWGFAEDVPPTLYTLFERTEGYRRVSLPHDAAIGRAPDADLPEGVAVGYMGGTVGTYMKFLDVPANWTQGCVLLEADGIAANAEVNLNGHQMGIHPSAYMPWLCDLTPRLCEGQNRLTIFVNNSVPRSSRWYVGTGIYRNLWLRVGGKVHLAPEPVCLRTERIAGGEAVLFAEVSVQNRSEREYTLRARVTLRRDRGRDAAPDQTIAASEACTVFVPARGEGKGRMRILVSNPDLWSVDAPNLYRVYTELLDGESLIDDDEGLFGIRTISIDAGGLRLNGEALKLRGGCLHHDHGILGAASYYDAEERRLRLHKQNGFNAIRCSHNPMSREMMEACDRVGLLAVAEAFDVWTMAKNINDYHIHFPAWWERDLEAFIVRDRNHPSIICWSIGNEVTERNAISGGNAIALRLAEKVRSLDDRPVTATLPSLFNGLADEDARIIATQMKPNAQNVLTEHSQKVFAARTEGFCSTLDFVGYNYLESRYQEDLKTFPERVICGTESFPMNIADIWEQVKGERRLLGDFVWTSWDYLGETWIGKYYFEGDPPLFGAFPARTGGCGCFDLIGDETPSLAFHRIAWGSSETYLSVLPPHAFGRNLVRSEWAWDGTVHDWYFPGEEGRRTRIDVYTAAPETELFVNGKSLGKKRTGEERRNVASFVTDYVSGEIVAISYREGKEVSRDALRTPSAAAKIVCKAERTEIPADGLSLAYVQVSITDGDGNVVPCEVCCTAEAKGGAQLIAFGSAASVTDENYTSGTFTSFRGRLLAVLRAGKTAGKATLIVSAEGLSAASVEITLR